MSNPTDWRALCAELHQCLEYIDRTCDVPIPGTLLDRARAALAQPEPEGVGDERITSIAKAVQECAFAWEPDARLIGNVRAEDIADLCGAVLAPPHNATR